MPWHIEKREGKFCVIKDADNSVEKCHGAEQDAKDHLAALYASEDKESLGDKIANFVADNLKAEKPMKTQGGIKRPASAYACVPDSSKPSTWQLPLTDSSGKVTTGKLGNAAAALSSGGFRGNKVDLACSEDSVKRRIRSEYRKLGVKPEDMPDSVKEHKSEFTTFKSIDGEWVWLLVVSNNRLDKETEILTGKSHEYFIDLLDSGKYKEMMGIDTPELWVWHIPVAIGDAVVVHYDKERGYLFAGGTGRKGDFYDRVFSALAKKEADEPGSLGASHGMPDIFLKRDPVNPAYIVQYASKEFTVLPKKHAANAGTWFPAVMRKEKGMDGIPQHKRQWLEETFGEETLVEFDQFLDTVAREADDAGIPKKELDMEDSEKELNDKELEEAKEESTETTETSTGEVTAEKETKKANNQDMSEEEEEEDSKEYVTREEVEELVKNVAVTMKGLTDTVTGVSEQLASISAELGKLKEDEESKIAEKAATTPQASLSALFGRYATSAVGSEQTKVDYHKERELHQAGPEEKEGDAIGTVGIPVVDNFINKQRGRSFSMPGQNNGQQS